MTLPENAFPGAPGKESKQIMKLSDFLTMSTHRLSHTIVSGSGILTPLKKTFEWKTCW